MMVNLEELNEADLQQMLWSKEIEILRLRKTIAVLINQLAVHQANGKEGENVTNKDHSNPTVGTERHRS